MKTVWGMLLTAAALMAQGRIPVVLSTDVGNEIDDQWTIVYLLLREDLDVKGILSAHAPSIPAPAGKNSLRILKGVVEGRMGLPQHPPLVAGADEPLAAIDKPRESAAVDFLIAASRGYSEGNRLQVLNIGAITDVASAILKDPGITKRIRVIQMGFNDAVKGGNEYNIANDPLAMQVVLNADVPLVTGPGDVCRRDLALTLEEARKLVAGHGPIGEWLYAEFEDWYYRHVKPLRKNDFTKPWMIWDNITLAYLLGMAEVREAPRPGMNEQMEFVPGRNPAARMTWITRVDAKRMWADFVERLDRFQATHAVPPFAMRF